MLKNKKHFRKTLKTSFVDYGKPKTILDGIENLTRRGKKEQKQF